MFELSSFEWKTNAARWLDMQGEKSSEIMHMRKLYIVVGWLPSRGATLREKPKDATPGKRHPVAWEGVQLFMGKRHLAFGKGCLASSMSAQRPVSVLVH